MLVDPQWLLAAGALVLGAAVQGFAGFGFGLVVVPLALSAGFALPQALAMLYPSVLIQCIANIAQRYEAVPWRAVRGWLLCPLPGLAAGLVVLHVLAATLPPAPIHIAVALLIVLSAVVQMSVRPRPRAHVGWTLTLPAAVTSGVLSATVGTGGPPLVLWCLAHDWSGVQLRACLYAVFGSTMVLLFPVLWIAFGEAVTSTAVLGLAMAPVTVLVALAFNRLAARVPTRVARRVAWGLLLLIAVRLFVGVVWV